MSISNLFADNTHALYCKEMTVDDGLNVGNLNIDELIINSTTDTSSTTSGALLVTGGIGVGQSLYVGNEIFSRTIDFYDNETNVAVDLFLSGTDQNLGNVSMFHNIISFGSYAMLCIPRFDTTGMSTNGTYIRTDAAVIPAKYRPVTEYYCPITVIQNNDHAVGHLKIMETGQLFIYGSFTASENNGFFRISVLYSLF